MVIHTLFFEPSLFVKINFPHKNETFVVMTLENQA